jgi:hypothetical protein
MTLLRHVELIELTRPSLNGRAMVRAVYFDDEPDGSDSTTSSAQFLNLDLGNLAAYASNDFGSERALT